MRNAGDERSSRADQARLSEPALMAFCGIAAVWQLTPIEQASLLGLSSPAELKRWQHAEAIVLPKDALERISYVLGIFRAINILIPRATQADGWIRRPNAAPLFGGRSALDRMLGGNVGDLYAVRQYLDAQLAS